MNQDIEVTLRGEVAEQFYKAHDMGVRMDWIVPMAITIFIEYLKAQNEGSYIAKINDTEMTMSRINLVIKEGPTTNEAQSN